MYSKFNVDVSCKYGDFDTIRMLYPGIDIPVEALYKVLPIIRGSSTVNGDSTHGTDFKHNYVTYHVKKIKLSCSFRFSGSSKRGDYVILFKVPYISEDKLPSLVRGTLGNMANLILYQSPELVLAYDYIRLNGRRHTDYTLYCNKSFDVGPNDYVGVCYFFSTKTYVSNPNVEASAEVTFKPI